MVSGLIKKPDYRLPEPGITGSATSFRPQGGRGEDVTLNTESELTSLALNNCIIQDWVPSLLRGDLPDRKRP